MTGEEIKRTLQSIPDESDRERFCVENGIAAFMLPALNVDGTDSEDVDIEYMLRPLPPHVHCVLKEFGSIYMIVQS